MEPVFGFLNPHPTYPIPWGKRNADNGVVRAEWMPAPAQAPVYSFCSMVSSINMTQPVVWAPLLRSGSWQQRALLYPSYMTWAHSRVVLPLLSPANQALSLLRALRSWPFPAFKASINMDGVAPPPHFLKSAAHLSRQTTKALFHPPTRL